MSLWDSMKSSLSSKILFILLKLSSTELFYACCVLGSSERTKSNQSSMFGRHKTDVCFECIVEFISQANFGLFDRQAIAKSDGTPFSRRTNGSAGNWYYWLLTAKGFARWNAMRLIERSWVHSNPNIYRYRSSQTSFLQQMLRILLSTTEMTISSRTTHVSKRNAGIFRKESFITVPKLNYVESDKIGTRKRNKSSILKKRIVQGQLWFQSQLKLAVLKPLKEQTGPVLMGLILVSIHWVTKAKWLFSWIRRFDSCMTNYCKNRSH